MSSRSTRFAHAACSLSFAVLLAGCSSGDPASRAERDPVLSRARTLSSSGDPAAVQAFQELIDRYPQYGQLHLETGQAYEQIARDPGRALYHYSRFIELSPESPKIPLAKDLVRTARIQFAATMPDDVRPELKEMVLMRREIEILKIRLAAATSAAARAIAVVSNIAAQSASGAQATVTTHTVRPGDSLRSIALKSYGNANRWARILEANRDVLKDANSVRAGQVLKIPPP